MTRRKPATRLASSNQVLYYPNGDDFNEGVLADLLEEAHQAKVHPFQFVWVTERRRDRRLNEWGEDGTYVRSQLRVRYSQLLATWKHLPGNDGARPYSFENERDRTNFIADALGRRANFGPAIQAFMAAGAQEFKTGIGRGAFYPLGERVGY